MTTTQEIRIEGSIPVNLPIQNNKRFLFISKDQQALTHGLHKYPAKFFPELPRWIIERYSNSGELILDPFMGSGTTNLEASVLGRNSIGVDIDPFSRFLSRVKTTLLPEDELLQSSGRLQNYIARYQQSNENLSIPDFPYRDNWFKPHVLDELAYLKQGIGKATDLKDIKNFYLLCLSSIIRAVSEADNNCTRTVVRKKLNKQISPLYTIQIFSKRMERNVNYMLSLMKAKPRGEVIIPDYSDARNLIGIPDNEIDLAVTSPPYLNAVDYPRTHQLELYWLGFANGSLRQLKEQHVGTEVVRAENYRFLHETGIQSADKAIKNIFSLDNRRAYIAYKYINDMMANLKEIHRVLKPNRRYVMVIGNNLVRGIRFETWKYLMEYAPTLGYSVDCHFISGIINHFIKVPRAERINDDHILVLQKCE